MKQSEYREKEQNDEKGWLPEDLLDQRYLIATHQ